MSGQLFEFIKAHLLGSLQAALAFPAGNAKRSHPKREREHGRAKPGLAAEFQAAQELIYDYFIQYA